MRPEKEAIAREIRSRIETANYTLIVNYGRMKVDQISEIRRRLRGTDSRMLVVKNTFLRHVLTDMGGDRLEGSLGGQIAIVTGAGDITRTAKVLSQYHEESGLLEVRGGKMGAAVLSAGDVQELALIPSREILLGKLVGTIAAPMTQLVGVMKQKVSSLLYVLKAIEEKKGKSQ